MESLNLLVVWVAYVLVHRTVMRTEPALKDFDIPLDPDKLENLELSNSMAVKAVCSVKDYVEKYRQGDSFFFSTLSTDSTLALASKISAKSPSILAAWERESSLAQERESDRWEIISSRKAQLAKVDDDVLKLEAAVDECERIVALTRGHRNSRMSAIQKAKLASARQILDDKEKRLNEKRNEARKLEDLPDPIVQPLPRFKEAALQVLFFLMIPNDLEVLFNLSFTAQHMLLPNEAEINIPFTSSTLKKYNVRDMVFTPGPATEWYNYFTCHGGKVSPRRTRVIVGSPNSPPAGSGWYPKDIRSYQSSSQGIWHPDGLQPRFYWKKSGALLCNKRDARCSDSHLDCIDPFTYVAAEVIGFKFVANLDARHASLQWALLPPKSGNQARENEPIVAQARPASWPQWMRKKDCFIMFCSLRSDPYLQFRRVCSTLCEHTLPLDERVVATLYMQALYHVGKINSDSEDEVILEWWQDRDRFGGGEELCKQLETQAHEVQNKPRAHKSIPTLALLSKFAAQWSPRGNAACGILSDASERWGDELLAEENRAESSRVFKVRARRAVYYLYSVLARSCGDLSTHCQIRKLLKVVLLADKCSLSGNSTSQSIANLKVLAQSFLVQRVSHVVHCVRQNRNLLSEALKCVFQAVPDNMKWSTVVGDHNRSLCGFTACSDGQTYDVNVLTGTFLFNGKPLRRLPSTVTSHPLFVRSFGDRNFDVANSQDGNTFCTTHPIDGKFYSFSVSEDGRCLDVFESEEAGMAHSLKLLDGTEKKVAGPETYPGCYVKQ